MSVAYTQVLPDLRWTRTYFNKLRIRIAASKCDSNALSEVAFPLHKRRETVLMSPEIRVSLKTFLRVGQRRRKRMRSSYFYCYYCWREQDLKTIKGLPWWSSGEEPNFRFRGRRFYPWSRTKIPYAAGH